ncbi:hypothetical protein GCM10009416_32300 [Craurococcus roseus]|uniref:Uncharacterized protein n=1 Tax=Craurococcus roseus TaxID=77585 RepID=A0ABP3QP71_9PROT
MTGTRPNPAHRNQVESANGRPDFPPENFPPGVFSVLGEGKPQGGVATGSIVLDLTTLAEGELLFSDA